jgi:serine/threonine-protein kinase ATR
MEWVQNTVGLRAVMKGSHDRIGVSSDFSKARALMDSANQDMAKLPTEEQRNLRELKLYRDWCELFPVVMHNWFMITFPDPSAWFAARSLFTRSCAVWSMVGALPLPCPLHPQLSPVIRCVLRIAGRGVGRFGRSTRRKHSDR